jgi:hypothetical protein
LLLVVLIRALALVGPMNAYVAACHLLDPPLSPIPDG